jgi:hypothetical protein
LVVLAVAQNVGADSMMPDARELALSVKASASSLEAAGQGALADISCRLADAVLDLAGDEPARLEAEVTGAAMKTGPWYVRIPVTTFDAVMRRAERTDRAEAELAALREAAQAVVGARSLYSAIPSHTLDALRAALNQGADK